MRFAHKWAFHQHGRDLRRRICDETQHLFSNIKKKKKERKSEIEQNICVLPVKMPKVSKLHETVEKKEEATKSQQQQPTHPGGTWFYWGKMSGSL